MPARRVTAAVHLLEATGAVRLRRHRLYPSDLALDEVLRRETAQIGYWLDSSAQTPEETVDDVLANLDRARV